jgi:hypothetical protein
MTKEAILTRLTALSSAHETVLANVRTHVLAGQAPTPFDPAHLTFAGVTLSPGEWEMVSRIERTAAEVDALISDARRELSFEGDRLNSAVAQHQGTPELIAQLMTNLNADIASLTAMLALKSVTFQWSLLPSA